MLSQSMNLLYQMTSNTTLVSNVNDNNEKEYRTDLFVHSNHIDIRTRKFSYN
jgi:hypothetical protein